MSEARILVPSPAATGQTARTLARGARLEASGLARGDRVSSAPLAFGVGSVGFVVPFRCGAAVLLGPSPPQMFVLRP